MSKSQAVYRTREESVARFVELYRAHECLWNTECPSYKSRAARNAAHRSIAKRIGGLSPREVARRIGCLRNAYQKELRRRESTQGHGEAGTGKPWFESLHAFLATARESTDVTGHKPEKLNETRQRRKVATPPRTGDRSIHILDAREKSFGSVRQSFPDECASFGDYVGAALSGMPFEYAVSAESEIHRVIVKYRIYAMRKISFLSQHSPPDSKRTMDARARGCPSSRLRKPSEDQTISTSDGETADSTVPLGK